MSDDVAEGFSRTGRCLCGAVRFRFAGEPIWIAHCHCESCRRATSSAVATFVSVRAEGFEFTGAEPVAYRSSPGALRRHCRVCGSPLSYEHEDYAGEMHLYAASLDRSDGVVPTKHDFWSERVPWLTVGDDLPKND